MFLKFHKLLFGTAALESLLHQLFCKQILMDTENPNKTK